MSKMVCQEKLEELKVKCGVVTGRAKPDMSFGEWIDLWYQTWSKPGLPDHDAAVLRGSDLQSTSFRTSERSR